MKLEQDQELYIISFILSMSKAFSYTLVLIQTSVKNSLKKVKVCFIAGSFLHINNFLIQ